MFRFASILAAGLLSLAVAAPVAAASTFNTGGSLTIAQLDWAFNDADSFNGGYVVAVRDQKGGTVVEYFRLKERFVQCTGADTPDDPTDDTWDFQLLYEYGIGSVQTLTIGKSYSGATATARLTLTIDRFDACTGESTTEVLADVPVRLDVTSTSPLMRESGHGSFHIPGQYNAHGSFKQTYRYGTGVATIGATSFDGDAVVGTVSWREHVNGR